MTYTIFWTLLPDDSWIATCDLHPAWRHKTGFEQDKAAAEKSLKGHATRNTRFLHEGWDGRV